MNIRLENNCPKQNENILDYFRRNVENNSYPRGCYGNKNGQKQKKLDRNDLNQFSRPSKQLNSSSPTKSNIFFHFQPCKQPRGNTAKTIQFSEKKTETILSKELDERKYTKQSCDWWSNSTHEQWKSADREEGRMNPRWNRSMKIYERYVWGGRGHRDAKENDKIH